MSKSLDFLCKAFGVTDKCKDARAALNAVLKGTFSYYIFLNINISNRLNYSIIFNKIFAEVRKTKQPMYTMSISNNNLSVIIFYNK